MVFITSNGVFFTRYGRCMWIASLLFCKLFGLLNTRMGKLDKHKVGYLVIDFEFLRAFVQINAAGNGYRAHGVAVPGKTYSDVIVSPNPNSERTLNK